MKRLFSIILLLMTVLLSFTSCKTVTIPNSKEAREKMEKLGYSVVVSTYVGEEAKVHGVKQITILAARKDNQFVQVYYFTDEEDTDAYFALRGNGISSGVEVVRKNKYSIYRGDQACIDDFLSDSAE